jgi:hypothetical protein
MSREINSASLPKTLSWTRMEGDDKFNKSRIQNRAPLDLEISSVCRQWRFFDISQ